MLIKQKTIKNESITRRIPKKVIEICQQNNLDFQSYDWEAHFGNTPFTLEEAKTFLTNVYAVKLSEEITQKEIQDKIQAQEQMQQEAIKEEEIRVLDEWEQVKPEKIKITEYDNIKDLIRIVIKGIDNKVRGLTLFGESGWAKTTITSNTIREEKLKLDKDWVYHSGKITPFALYQKLLENRNKIVILDDCESIFSSEDCVSLLKNCLQDIDGKRLVFWNSSKLPDGVQRIFEFDGRIIILANEIPRKNNESVKAVISRTIPYQVKFNHKEKMKILKEILDKRDDLNEQQKTEVYEKLEKAITIATDFNIRTLEKLIAFYKYDKEKSDVLFSKILKENKNEKIVWELMNGNKSVDEQVDKFIELTFKSRATFFRTKQRIQEKMGKNAK